ncbi:MAG: SCO1664 family protein [Chloroflexi bacterium]|nr:MAG: SCO1664 family protein [Chloroflexota bacterium]
MTVNQVLELLTQGRLETEGLLPWSSNYTFLATVSYNGNRCLAVYKPRSGERPLWDFPEGTLCLREVATYVVSQALGWPYVPPTVLRDGPHGLGSVQLYIDADPEEHYFTLQEQYVEDFQHLAALDYVINNADRKSGHCLLGSDGRIWAVDHGVTFHTLPKLRTVIWDFAGQPIPDPILDDLEAFHSRLTAGDPVQTTLQRLLARDEIDALRQRVRDLLRNRVFPRPDPHRRHIPWPPV